MRLAVGGIVVVVGLGMALVGVGGEQPAQLAQHSPVRNVDRAVPSDQLIALSCDAEEGRQQVTLIDPKTRVMSVYHIERATGKITLKSVRSVQWDLLMEEFNGTSPSPRDIRALLPQR